MAIFSEIYNCYYKILKTILTNPEAMSANNMRDTVLDLGYEESILHLIPKLLSNDWQLFDKNNDVFTSKISKDFFVPLSNMQKAWLKSILLDERISLFLDKNQLEAILEYLKDIEPLFYSKDFYYFDQFSDKDDYTNAEYINNFRLILNAIKNKQFINILYDSKHNKRINHYYIPCKLEYSIKNNKFRIVAYDIRDNKHPKIETINMSRIKEVIPTNKYYEGTLDINLHIKESYYKDPVTLIITNNRNALERAMLQFANYEKNTTKLDDNTYECLIYYNKGMETELLIEILSFGPMIKVVGNEDFLKLLKIRLFKQQKLDYQN